MTDLTVEQLKEELAKINAENAQLKSELAKQKASSVHDWTLQQRIQISNIFNRPDGGVGLVGSTIAVAGWVKTLRLQGRNNFAFLKLNDGSSWEDIQVVIDKDVPGFKGVEDHTVTFSSSVMVIGKIQISSGKDQKIELVAIELRLLGTSNAETFPISKKAHSLEFLRSIGHLRSRTNIIQAITKVRNALSFSTHKFFQDKGFIYLNSPLITASDCEGAGEMFQVTTLLKEAKDVPQSIPRLSDGKVDYSYEFFKKPAFLTVSGQLNAEIYACALGNVYTFGPTFRAEDSNTSRHLAEFWMIEPEMAFADLNENMHVAEQYIKFVLGYVLQNCSAELLFLEDYEQAALEERKKLYQVEEKSQKAPKDIRGFRSEKLCDRLRHVVNADFAKITYTEAIQILQKSTKTFDNKVEWGIDLASEHERWMAEEHFKRPVIVRNYPKEIKAFYMRLNEDGKTVAAMDVLVPGVGELIGGSQREERADVLEERIKESRLDPVAYGWYLELRLYGTVVHSGFGAGFERLVCYATGMENIRDAIPFPRYPGHCDY